MTNIIQIISYNTDTKYNDNRIINSKFDSPNSLDEFDINIIDLSSEFIYRYKAANNSSINIEKDLLHISSMISNTKKTKILFLLPQNVVYQYKLLSGKYHNKIELKNYLSIINEKICKNIFKVNGISLLYENTKTTINNDQISSNFYFSSPLNTLTKSVKSEKSTTIAQENHYFTCLDLNSVTELFSFLMHIGLYNETDSIVEPDWFKEINFFDDDELTQNIEKNNMKILELSKENTMFNEALSKNNYYKSILYESGDNLVSIVFDILEELLDYDLNQFQDLKKEDFLIKFDNITFIGEIKGISKNIKSQNISQLDLHLNSYLDKLEENKISENVKSILIICHQRNKKISERDEIHETQIALAKRNKSLIIEAVTLLQILENFRKKIISKDQIIETLTNEVGLLSSDIYHPSVIQK